VTIEIHEPELEALIQRRMESGRFRSVEEVLLTALKSSAPHMEIALDATLSPPTGGDLVIAMQSSPYKEISLEPTRPQLPVRDVAL